MWTYGGAVFVAGPVSKIILSDQPKEMVCVFQSDMTDFDSLDAVQSVADPYCAHFTVCQTGVVLQHYLTGAQLQGLLDDTDCADGIWIAVTGNRDWVPPVLQWDALMLLLKWLFSVVVPRSVVTEGLDLKGVD